jgi:hypothetical protein
VEQARTSEVLDPNIKFRIKMLRRYVYRLLAVDMHLLVFASVVCGARGYMEQVLFMVCHCDISVGFPSR